jgi:CheY-like chemotaxis protein
VRQTSRLGTFLVSKHPIKRYVHAVPAASRDEEGLSMPTGSPTATATSRERHTSSLDHAPTAECGSRWRVLIVDPQASIRKAIRMILQGYDDLIEVIGEASNGDDAVELAATVPVDLVLMDTDLPNAVETTRHIRKLLPQVVILGMSAEYTPYVYNAMIAAGAVAFIRTEDAADLLFRSIVFAMCTYGPRHIHMAPVQPSVQQKSFAVSSAT